MEAPAFAEAVRGVAESALAPGGIAGANPAIGGSAARGSRVRSAISAVIHAGVTKGMPTISARSSFGESGQAVLQTRCVESSRQWDVATPPSAATAAAAAAVSSLAVAPRGFGTTQMSGT